MRLKSVSEASLGVLEGSWGYFGDILGHVLELKDDLESIFEAIYRNIVKPSNSLLQSRYGGEGLLGGEGPRKRFHAQPLKKRTHCTAQKSI